MNKTIKMILMTLGFLIVLVALTYMTNSNNVNNDLIEMDESNTLDSKIESEKGFEIIFTSDKTSNNTKNEIYTIVDKSETDKYNYSIYSVAGTVKIKVNGKEYLLRDALLEDKITMKEILLKAKEDFPNNPTYDDGGSTEYHYKDYTILRLNTISGNWDVYIGNSSMTIFDIEIERRI